MIQVVCSLNAQRSSRAVSVLDELNQGLVKVFVPATMLVSTNGLKAHMNGV